MFKSASQRHELEKYKEISPENTSHIFFPSRNLSMPYVYVQRNEFRETVIKLGSMEALKLYDKIWECGCVLIWEREDNRSHIYWVISIRQTLFKTLQI